MISPSLAHKIAKTRAFAPHELPKARLCAKVIWAAVDGETAIQLAIEELRQAAGNNWSMVTALQFMSGRRGEFAIDCAEPIEQVSLHLAHLAAKQLCSDNGLGGAAPPDGIDVAKFNALVAAVKSHFH